MQQWPDDCVDMVFCSPPYEAARTYGINFKLKEQEWVDWAVVGFLECLRVTKGMVCWVVEGRTKNYRYTATPLLFAADLHRAGVHLRKPPIYQRNGIPGNGGPDWLRNDYEFIICGSKGGKLPWSDNTTMGHPPKRAPGGEMSYRLSNGARVNQWGGTSERKKAERKQDGSRGKSYRPSHIICTKVGTPRRPNGSREKQSYVSPVKANPGNVIHCKVGGGLMGHNLAHENEAPFAEKLVEFFIKSFCKPCGIVCDPFSGSGTTAAVALKNRRNFIGIDIRQTQVDLAYRRLETICDSFIKEQENL
jgi:site-specific DNA-methyltransferase (adenine-specific)